MRRPDDDQNGSVAEHGGDNEGYTYVDARASLRRLTAAVAASDRVALDTEANSLYRYHHRVCLIQASLKDRHFIVDPLAGLDLTPFLDALARTPLILHGADYDLRMLRSSFGFRPRRFVFDTMIAAQLLGYEQVGLAPLVEAFFGVTLNKAAQKADWTRRPLPQRELSYAVDDTRYLERLADLLGAELESLGRLEWHREACGRLVELTGVDNHRDPETEWRVKGANRLSQRELAVLRRLYYWREEEAARSDRPPFKVLGNARLVNLAVWAAAHPNGRVEEAPPLPRTVRGRRRRSLERALRQAWQTPDADWPPRRAARSGPRRKPFSKALLDDLLAECARLAAKLDLPPSTLASRAALTEVVRARACTVPELIRAGSLMRWQAELLAPAARKLFSD